jgi:hypothetical protein
VAEADRLAAAGQARRGAELYREVMAGPTGHANQARDNLKHLIEAPPASLDEAAGAFQVALDLERQNQPLVPDLFERGRDLAGRHADDDPKGALALLETVAPLAPKPEDQLALRRRLLERLVAQTPDDAELASRLAVVYEAQGELGRCEALLAPHADRLGVREGAAILGRIYAGEGKYDQAHALLSPYVEGRLSRLRAAEQGYEQAVNNAQSRVIDELKSRRAADFDYAKFGSASEPQKRAMATAYVGARLKDDPSLRAAQQSLRAESPVVPAALDLGIVRLHRASALADPAARRAELEQAEKTFLAVGGLAGQTDAYRLHLGQVYYWLGKHAEGRKLFDELLKSHNREHEILLAVSHLLREVGVNSEARSLAEEAFNKEADPAKKHQAALVRSLLFTDLDDQITWLERCNPDTPETKASLAAARGDRAAREGKDDEAAAHYRQAIDTYGRMPETAGTLNNSALAHFSLYQLTREREQLTRGLDKLDRAVALKGSDSILLGNAAHAALESAVRDLVGPAVDFKVLKQEADLSLLAFLYRDQAGERKYAEALGKHPGFLRARGFLEKLMVLAPKRPDPYVLLAGLHAYTRDKEGVDRVWQRLKDVELDLARQKRETLDAYAGKDDDNRLRDVKNTLAREEAVAAAARQAGGVTLAVAAVRLAQTHMSAAAVKAAVDPDAVVKLAEEARAAAPSSATESALISALCFRAHQSLIQRDPGYAALAAKTRRSLGDTALTYVLGRPGALRDKALAEPDVMRALKLKAERVKAFPEDQGPTSWAFLRAAYPQEADQVARKVREDRQGETLRALTRAVSPLSAHTALEDYWALLLLGKEAEADEVLKRCAAQGVPMPVESK